jgi:hypothetical protein
MRSKKRDKSDEEVSESEDPPPKTLKTGGRDPQSSITVSRGIDAQLLEIADGLKSLKVLAGRTRFVDHLRVIARAVEGLMSRNEELRVERDEWRRAHGVLLDSVVPAMRDVQRRTASATSYAAVAGRGDGEAPVVGVGGRKYETRPPRPALRILPKEGSDCKSSSETQAALLKAVDVAKLGVRVNGVRRCRDAGVLVFPSSSEDVRRLTDLPELKKAGLEVSVPTPRLPRVMLYDVPRLEHEVFMERLYAQNIEGKIEMSQECFRKSCTLSHRAGPKTGASHVVMHVTPEVRGCLLSSGRVYIDWQSCRVRDFLGVTLCRKCCMYGHPEKYCRETVPMCSHCGVAGHSRTGCPRRESTPKCATCTRYRRPAQDHTTGGSACPAREAAVEREIARTAFQ